MGLSNYPTQSSPMRPKNREYRKAEAKYIQLKRERHQRPIYRQLAPLLSTLLGLEAGRQEIKLQAADDEEFIPDLALAPCSYLHHFLQQYAPVKKNYNCFSVASARRYKRFWLNGALIERIWLGWEGCHWWRGGKKNFVAKVIWGA